ncbi:MAG TPA: metal ABC transporter permease [Candidatus Moranbacteria bacterium]|nr:metal ABC transporter permease [Candidatus Moranbacteria bacterium]
MINFDLISLLQYGFVQKAFLAGTFTALSCSALGLFLVLRKMSLVGDGLSHVSFGAIALGMLAGVYPTYLALPIIVIAAILILKISEKTKVYGDAAIGIVSAAGVAGGVILASLSNGFNVDLLSYLFGNILAASSQEVIFSIGLSLFILATIYLFYWDLFSISFDEEYAQVSGIPVGLVNYLLVILTAITVLLSIKVVGIMLVSALLIIPAVTALQISRQFKTALLISGLTAALSVIIGIIFSLLLNLPTGATIVLVNLVFFILAILIGKMR